MNDISNKKPNLYQAMNKAYKWNSILFREMINDIDT